jgi:hypothetical protein
MLVSFREGELTEGARVPTKKEQGPKTKTAPDGAVLGNGSFAFLAERAGCDAADVVTAHTDIGERLVGQVAKFVERTAVANPALCNADRVHGFFLGCLVQAAGIAVAAVDIYIVEVSFFVQCK